MIFFKKDEFNCPCCGENHMDEVFLSKLDELRSNLGHPLFINSGYRCTKHNEEVGGSPRSQHLIGKAADISLANMTNETKFNFMKLIKSRFTGIGVAKTFVHIDNRDKQAFWVY